MLDHSDGINNSRVNNKNNMEEIKSVDVDFSKSWCSFPLCTIERIKSISNISSLSTATSSHKRRWAALEDIKPGYFNSVAIDGLFSLVQRFRLSTDARFWRKNEKKSFWTRRSKGSLSRRIGCAKSGQMSRLLLWNQQWMVVRWRNVAIWLW